MSRQRTLARCAASMKRAFRKPLVFWSGPVHARIMLVGEAPGAQEMQRGKPFVGKSGIFLDAMLKKAGMKRNNLFVTNAVFWRVRGTPSRADLRACAPYLQTVIAIVRPRLICTLGNTPLKALAGSGKILACRGKLLRVTVGTRTFALLPTVHPFAAMTNRNLAKLFLGDLRRVKRMAG